MLSAAGIKCYECSGSEILCSKSNLQSNADDKLKECGSTQDTCVRIWQKVSSVVVVENDCSTAEDCDVQKRACDLLDDIDGYECAVGCCSTNACNTGLPVSINVFILTMSSVLGLALVL